MNDKRTDELRRKAEERLAEKASRIEELEQADLKSLAHELAVHQVEPELQNEELKESERRFRQMFEGHQDIMLLIEPEGGRIIDANPAAAEFYGYPRETLCRMKITDINQLPAEQTREEWQKAVSRERNQFIFPHRMGSGEIRTVEVHSTPVKVEKRNMLFSIIHDITDRRKSEEELIKTRDELKSILSSITDGFFTLDNDFKVTYFNRAAEKILNRKAEGVLGRNLFEAFPEAKGSIFEENYSKALKEKLAISFETYFAPQRYENWYDVRVFPSAEGITVFFQVITERKKAEEALLRYSRELEATNKELEAFSYSVSHDLKAPLRTLDGFSAAAIEEYGDKLGETGKEYLNHVRKASQTMARLIEDMLNLSRISQAEMYTQEVNLSELVESIENEIRKSQPERQAEFSIQPEITGKGDPRLLKIALRNLMENAWKFTGKGLQTRIEFGKTEQENEQVYFIKDNGVGFNMRYADKLFQPFQRMHSESEFPGTGIGLATVQRIVNRHGGRIWAESETGQGATFFFTLG